MDPISVHRKIVIIFLFLYFEIELVFGFPPYILCYVSFVLFECSLPCVHKRFVYLPSWPRPLYKFPNNTHSYVVAFVFTCLLRDWLACKVNMNHSLFYRRCLFIWNRIPAFEWYSICNHLHIRAKRME